MPKVTGPLFSVTASGSLAGVLTYAQHASTNIVRAMPSHQPPSTPLQTAQRDRIAALAACWTAQPQAIKDLWIARAVQLLTTGYKLWSKQWQLQGSTCQTPPTLP